MPDMTLDEDSADAPGEHLSPDAHAFERGSPRSSIAVSLVLYVGLDPEHCSAARGTLAQEGMRSLRVAGLVPALQAASRIRFDAAVIDAEVLGRRGPMSLIELHGALRCPLLVVASLPDEIDEIFALELGASAYLAAPVTPRRLRAHLVAAMRSTALAQPVLSRVRTPAQAAPYGAAGWRVDQISRELRRGPKRVALTELQCKVLQCLVEARGSIVPRARLAGVLPNLGGLASRSIDVYIHRLRQRLSEEGVDDLRIETARGRGYQIAVPT